MFPVMLDLRDRPCLVVGGGPVALRKIENLLSDHALVTVVTPQAMRAIHDLAGEGALTLELRPYAHDASRRFSLVIAATDDRAVNRLVSEDAKAEGVFVNVADDPELCTFHLPSRIRRGSLQLAIASDGGAPFAVRRLRQFLERRLDNTWGPWLEQAKKVRRLLKEGKASLEQQEQKFDAFFASTVSDSLPLVRLLEPEALRALVEGAESLHDGPTPEPTGAPVTNTPRAGFVSLVGSGPGDPLLLTLKARKRLFQADVVVYDRLAQGALPPDLPPHIRLIDVGKEAANHKVPQHDINALLLRLAQEGLRVVRFKGGDPFVFGRGSEEAEALVEAKIPFEVVPGITSGIAGPAYAGIPVTHRRESVRVTLLTGNESSSAEESHLRWDVLAADPHSTLVGYMGVAALPGVVTRLLAGGMEPSTPAALLERATTSKQRLVRTTLEALPRDAQQFQVRPPALFIIGPTVHHAETLAWFARQPLAGRRFVMSPSLSEAAERLRDVGAEVIEVSIPLSPAALVALESAPCTDLVASSPGELEVLSAESSCQAATVWCLTEQAGRWAERHKISDIESVDGLQGAWVQRLLERALARGSRPAGTMSQANNR